MGQKLPDAPLVYMHEHFKKLNHSNLKNGWAWYSITDLQNIIDMIEQIQKDDPSKTGDGVRLYHGAYNDKVCDYIGKIPDSTGKPTSYKDHEGHNTVFFVPTYKGSNVGEHVDVITPESAAAQRTNYQNNIDLPNPLTGGLDVGDICPPPPPGSPDCSKSGSNL